jgi:surface protein
MIQIGINISVKGSAISGPLPPAPVNTVPPVISGTTTLGSVITTTNGTWTNTPSLYIYQWKRNTTNVGTNTPTYTLVLADSNAAITCVVTAINGGGSASATSNIITAQTYSAPAIVSAPVISGTTTLGSVLTTTDGVWTGNPTPTFTYQWKRGVSNITSATSATYTLVLADSGAAITCVVTAINAVGNNNSTSNIITADNYPPVNTVLPVISGTNTLGSVITTTNGTWTNSPSSFTYQWKRNATNVGTNTPTYTLVLDDSNAAITCVVTAINIGGSASATSNIITAEYPFISTFRTTTASETVTLPYEVAGTYSGTIDWGDGGPTSVNSYANRAHVYAVAGDYVITVTGVTTGFRFNNTGDRTKIRSIQAWGGLRLGNNGWYFWGCTNLTLTAVNGVLDTTGTTNFLSMFRECTALTTINNINSWNTSAVTSMNSMFFSAYAFNQPLSFNTSAVNNMASMFNSTIAFNSSLTFNTSAVTNMAFMFGSAQIFNQPLTFNTSAVTNMAYMFNQAFAFNQPLNWDTSAVINMASMFQQATSFNSSLTFNTSAVTSMSSMFFSATAFNQPLSFNTSAVINMNTMFSEADAFNQPLNWDTSAVTNMFQMFQGTNSFNSSLTFNTISVTNMNGMFSFAYAFNQPLVFNTSAVTSMSQMFSNAITFNSPLTFSNTSAVTSMANMFQNTNINQPLSFNTSAVTDMSFMFRDCFDFNQPLSFNTSAVTNMSNMFFNAPLFDQNIGSWNVANVTNFTNFMGSKTDLTFSTTNLDAIYNGWVTVQSGRTITFGTAKYSVAGVAGRNYLTGTKLWTITDGGL